MGPIEKVPGCRISVDQAYRETNLATILDIEKKLVEKPRWLMEDQGRESFSQMVDFILIAQKRGDY
ncbi:MAG: hypothetical protein GY786_20345 [Proteobacteria bacterium]|nr:hypothetical protein [Pseudomonadota bacterium]